MHVHICTATATAATAAGTAAAAAAAAAEVVAAAVAAAAAAAAATAAGNVGSYTGVGRANTPDVLPAGHHRICILPPLAASDHMVDAVTGLEHASCISLQHAAGIDLQDMCKCRPAVAIGHSRLGLVDVISCITRITCALCSLQRGLELLPTSTGLQQTRKFLPAQRRGVGARLIIVTSASRPENVGRTSPADVAKLLSMG